MVRRDWCSLSKDASKVILDHILSTDNKEDIISNIHTYLHDLGKQIKEHKVKLNKYIITKKLTKSVNDYPDGKSQPHVKVVKDLISKGHQESKYINHYIPYIICIGENKSYA